MNLFSRSIRAKILATLAVFAVVIVGISVFAVSRLGTLQSANHRTNTSALAPVLHAKDLQYSTSQLAAVEFVEGFVPPIATKIDAIRQHATAVISRDLTLLKSDPMTATQRAALAKVEQVWSLAGPIMQSPQTIKAMIAPANLPKMLGLVNALSAANTALVNATVAHSQQIQSDADAAYSSAVTVTWLVAGISLIAALLLGFVVSGRITRPLRETERALDEVSQGDLTQQVHVATADEVGRMAQALNTTISTVHDVVQQLETDAGRLASYAQKTIDESTTPEAKASATEIAQMAEGLDAMISIFQLRRSEDESIAA
jgi:methyl-accepting chemotaxis protein